VLSLFLSVLHFITVSQIFTASHVFTIQHVYTVHYVITVSRVFTASHVFNVHHGFTVLHVFSGSCFDQVYTNMHSLIYVFELFLCYIVERGSEGNSIRWGTMLRLIFVRPLLVHNKDLEHPRANTPHKPHQATHEHKTNELCFMQKGTQRNQTCFKNTSRQTRPEIDAGGDSLRTWSINST